MTQFVSLHVHTYFSLLDGLSSPKSLVARAKELGHPAIAISDHGVMHGAIELYREALKEGIKPIIGCEAYLKDQSSTDRLKEFVTTGDGDYKVKGLFHQLILAMNPQGYKNLCKLTSRAHLSSDRGNKLNKQSKSDTSTRSKSWCYFEELEEFNEGLIVTSGCMAGIIPQSIMAGDYEYAEEVARKYQSIFGDRFYIEIQDHSIGDEADHESAWLNVFLMSLSEKLGIEVVATADNHYTVAAQKSAHDALLCINTGKLLSDEKRMRYEGAYWLPSGDEMVERLSRYLPIQTALRAVENTVRLAARIEDYQLKGIPTPPKFTLPDDFDNADDYLEELAYEGLRKRFYGVPPQKFIDRLEQELDLFKSKNLSEYFLVVSDICRFCTERGILTGPGRGSAAGSLLSYVLEITKLDPIHWGLVLERFLNPERMSYPDIDLDIDKERRHEVIQYLQEKYGSSQVAQIATFNRMVSKSALKDTGRVFGDFYDYANSITKKIPVVRGNPALLSELLSNDSIYPEFNKAYRDNKLVQDKTKENSVYFKDWVDLAVDLENTVKSVGIHAAGVVIGWKSLDEIVPLMRSKEGATVTQYSMEDLEYLGLLKMDLLGLKTLSVIDRTLEAVKRLKGEAINLESINLNDQHVLRHMVAGDGVGIFQFEADGAVRLLREIKPTSIDDVSAITSLNRPGCLDMGMHKDYARRKAGLDKTTYLTPALEPIMSSTFGLCVFQEQMLRVFNEIAGFSLGKSDNARRACISGDAVLAIPGYMDITVREYVNKLKSKSVPSRLIHCLNENYEVAVLGLINDAFFNGLRDVYELTTKSDRKIKVTTDHLFYSRNKWTSIDNGLKVGDKIAVPKEIRLDSEVLWDEIVGITYVGIEDVYDLSVSRYHNFVANGFYVHNCGKKKAKEMEVLEPDFINGCSDNWIDEPIARQLWEIMLASAEYTFNSSHAYCYSVITLFTAWLKHYYRCEFMAALCSMEENKKEKKKYEEDEDKSKLVDYLVKCKAYKIKLLPPDINESTADFVAVNDSTIRWGLRAIKGLGDAAINPILLERSLSPFKDYLDFCQRTNLGSDSMTALIKAGALDCLHSNRAEMLAYLEPLKKWRIAFKARETRKLKWEKEGLELMAVNTDALNPQQRLKHEKRFKQVEDNLLRAVTADVQLPDIPTKKDLTQKQRLEGEKEVLGLYASGHPLDQYPVGCEPFENVEKGKVFVSTILVNSARMAKQKNGNDMMFCTIEDKLGATFDLTVFNKQYAVYGHLFIEGSHVSIHAKGNEWKGKVNLVLETALKPTQPQGEQPVEVIVGAWEDEEF